MSQVSDLQTGEPAAPVKAPAPAPIGIFYVEDSNGRKIGLKKLKPSQRFMLAESVVTKTPSGEMQAIFVASVVSIGEDGCAPLTSHADLLKRLDELDDAGLAAITAPLLKLYGLALDEKDIDLAKNS